MKVFRTNPYMSILNEFLIDSPAPVNINYFYNLGSLLGINQVILIITGISLAKHYNPSVELAFSSSEHIVRDVNNGWLLRYVHANGVSLFFMKVYVHIGKGLYYGSYRSPRRALWIVGVLIFIIKKATAFIGLIGRKWIKNQRNLVREIRIEKKDNGRNPLEEAEKIYDNIEKIETQLLILNENRRKAGIYLIYNKINNNFYIGSAITNRINVRFRNHMIHGTGSKITNKAVKKYGIENFKFAILEYYPGIIAKENLKKGHLLLLERENYYINKYSPIYNIKMSATPGPNNYTHKENTKEEKRNKYSLERKERIGALNRGKEILNETRLKMRESAYERYKKDPGQKERISKKNSKPVVLQDEKLNVIKNFAGVRSLSKYLGSCHKTVNKAIKKGKLLKGFFIKYKT